MIVYKIMEDGGFVCGDTDSTLTSYAYPTSTHATRAKKNAAHVAQVMLDRELKCLRVDAGVRAYDARNWEKLALPIIVKEAA